MAIALYGITLGLRGIRDAEIDLLALAGTTDGRDTEVAIASVRSRRRRYVIAFVCEILFVLVGVVAIIPGTTGAEQVVSLTGLFGGALGFVLMMQVDQADRAAMRRRRP